MLCVIYFCWKGVPVSADRLSSFRRRTNTLAFRAHILYLSIPAVTLLIVFLIGQTIASGIADDSSHRLARQYSIEAAANFLVKINQHFVLMQQISRSTTISRWLANEYDMVNRDMAFGEIMGYAAFAPDTYLMFTIYETWHGYNFSHGLTPEEFTPWGRLPGGEASQWFFDTRDAEMPFILNVQRTLPVDDNDDEDWELYVWSNHRMYYQDRLVGVVTVGSSFDDIFNTIFGGFDVNYKRGYIIDRHGAVRVDSAMILEVLDEGIALFPAIPEAAYNPILLEYLSRHLQRLEGGVFQPGEGTLEAISLSGGIYTYASITPIIGTDWSVVVLSNHLAAFGMGRYTPLIYIAAALLVLSALTGSLLVRRGVLDPLFRLSQSAAASSMSVKTRLFGLDRNDEIGDLSRTVQSMRDRLYLANMKLKENERAMLQVNKRLEHREKLLYAVNQVSEALLIAGEKDSTNTLKDGMEIVGRCLDVDRVEIWRNETANGEPCIVKKYEWVSEIGKTRKRIPLDAKIKSGVIPGAFEMFSGGDYLNGPLSKLPQEYADFLGEYEIISIVILPLFVNKEFIGLFIADDCRRERVFIDDEMRMFASAGLMFASVFNRNIQRDLAITDVLTGVRNRRYLMETAEQQLRTCIENNLDFSVIMFDIDHFKPINDKYGHTNGDEVLKILTSRVRHVLKHDTLLARYGGDEFAVTLPGVDHGKAIKTAWRIQRTVQNSAFLVGGSLEINVTSSFGVASKTENYPVLAEIIDKADKALYKAKAAGRNTVVSYHESH